MAGQRHGQGLVKNTDRWSFWRRCCESPFLPNDCECFETSSFSDFSNTPFHKPACPSKLGVTFYFFDREHTDVAVDIRADSIAEGPFDGRRNTVFISHGFNDKIVSPWVNAMKNELLVADDVNVIVVDWQQAAKGNYLQAVANTRTVGAMLARLILDLQSVTQASFPSFHLVGHSLGAHVSGTAGKEIERLTGAKLGRITGLDPAGPSFESYSANVRLDKSDASFVDVIHTDAEGLISSGFGIRTSIGHVDFWPNGGEHQPGCPDETYGILTILKPEAGVDTLACSHMRCLDFFSNSINLCTYDPQGSCTMGYHVSSECRGNYSPVTKSVEPFC
ncbi:pancreatic lipase-related protein [Elysia marginata]|uniref:Pancreatic lipase-related protein n=1 Tax=Elysia marginata TaxID=1093978 RepID=A0AAV4F0Q2_9GAST|nr:pancreatic lipase-related protein [Elysia marginata]